MIVNDNIKPRRLTDEELAARARGVFDSYANYLVFCGACGKMKRPICTSCEPRHISTS